jgi:hypothetical protein
MTAYSNWKRRAVSQIRSFGIDADETYSDEALEKHLRELRYTQQGRLDHIGRLFYEGDHLQREGKRQ